METPWWQKYQFHTKNGLHAVASAKVPEMLAEQARRAAEQTKERCVEVIKDRFSHGCTGNCHAGVFKDAIQAIKDLDI